MRAIHDVIGERAAYRVLLPHPIRYNDLDGQGHVNNATYATYFEFGRTEFFFAIEPGLISRGTEPVLARLEIDFRRELFYPGTIEIAIAVADVGGSSARFAQAVFRDGDFIASGLSVMVKLDSATRKSAKWTDAQRAILARYKLGAA